MSWPPRRLWPGYYGWVLVLTLGVTETISWGILYYGFSVFVVPMQAELGWTRADTTGAFSLALLLSGLAAFPVGRWLDRHGPRLLMTLGAVAATLLVLAWSRVQGLVSFYLVWALIGLSMAAVLYQPAFVVVATWFSRRRARALTVLTLMAGWASVIFVPLAGWLVQQQGWRAALVTLAVLLAVGTILPHALLLRRRPEDLGLAPDGEPLGEASRRGAAAPKPPPLGRVVRQPSFRWLAVTFCLGGFAEAALAVHLVPYLSGRGYEPTFAASMAGLIGAAALGGRVIFAPFGDRLPRERVAAAIYALQALSLLVLLLAGGWLVGVLAFVLLYGASRGTSTLARANLVAEVYSRAQYGAISGLLALVSTAAAAAAPVSAGAAFDALQRYEPLLGALVLLAVGASLAALRVGGDSPAATESAAR